ncbi:helix-turn-helix domain-containing protein [Malonomonas rubra]|uniref:helix-turn-helix domain-containing protein n=1 Tax=Malonomonas rubra TaxID=57040 RepID=UPI00137A9F41|nr:helix-turn-helix domain-containing protein [Malonomonas rubra]
MKFGRKPKLSEEEDAALVSGIKEGLLSKTELAEMFDISVTTVYRRIVALQTTDA